MKFADMNAQIDEFMPDYKGDRKPLYALLDNAYGLGYKEAGKVWNSVLLNQERTKQAVANSPAVQQAAKAQGVGLMAQAVGLVSRAAGVPVPVLQPRDPQDVPRPIGDGWGKPVPAQEPPRDVGTACTWHTWVAEGPFLERCTNCKSVRPKP